MGESYELTSLQVALMRVLWERGEATVAEVQEGLREERELAQTTVATLLSRLEKKGVVAHRTEGRQYVYRATVAEAEVRRSMLEELTERLFGGDVPELVSHLLGARGVEADELARIKELIREKEREMEESGDR
jgi:BlaI family penicillinase repressor